MKQIKQNYFNNNCKEKKSERAQTKKRNNNNIYSFHFIPSSQMRSDSNQSVRELNVSYVRNALDNTRLPRTVECIRSDDTWYLYQYAVLVPATSFFLHRL